MDFELAMPETIAEAIAQTSVAVDYRPVERDGSGALPSSPNWCECIRIRWQCIKSLDVLPGELFRA